MWCGIVLCGVGYAQSAGGESSRLLGYAAEFIRLFRIIRVIRVIRVITVATVMRVVRVIRFNSTVVIRVDRDPRVMRVLELFAVR